MTSIPKVAMSMIKHLFMLAIMDVAEDGGLAKQLAIKELEKRVVRTIATNSYGFFEIIVLPRDSEDIANPILSMTVKNFEFFEEGHAPRRFRIVISHSWEKAYVYQASLDGHEFIQI